MDPIPTRDRLLQVAADVFLAHGLENSSMERVRQSAEVSNGSLYHHFPTKAQLADALYARALLDLHATLLKPIAGRAGTHFGVKGLVRSYVDWVLQNPGPARLLHELKPGGGSSSDWQQVNAGGMEMLRQWVQRRVDAGEMRPMPFQAWVAVVFAPCLSLTPQWLQADPLQVAQPVRTALEYAAWYGVAVPAEPR